MSLPEDQISEIKKIYPRASIHDDGGVSFVFIPEIKLPDGCEPDKVDVLLCPAPRDGYNSRLYFSEKIKSKQALNWLSDAIRILERNWYVYSWRTNQTDLRLAQMISIHLTALR